MKQAARLLALYAAAGLLVGLAATWAARHYTLAHPWALLGLAVPLLLGGLRLAQVATGRQVAVQLNHTAVRDGRDVASAGQRRSRPRLRRGLLQLLPEVPGALRLMALGLLVIAAARPHPGLVFARVARAVRMTIALQSRLMKDLAALDLHRVDPQLARDRGALGLAGGNVELALVQRALDAAVLDIAVGQARVLVGADVVDGVDRIAHPADRNVVRADLHAQSLVLADRIGIRHRLPGHPVSP
jgi:hypothetical protein